MNNVQFPQIKLNPPTENSSPLVELLNSDMLYPAPRDCFCSHRNHYASMSSANTPLRAVGRGGEGRPEALPLWEQIQSLVHIVGPIVRAACPRYLGPLIDGQPKVCRHPQP